MIGFRSKSSQSTSMTNNTDSPRYMEAWGRGDVHHDDVPWEDGFTLVLTTLGITIP